MKLGDPAWVDNEIHREHALTNNRMSWYVASQAFLLTAFSIGLNVPLFLAIEAHHLIPYLGMSISAFSWFALIAASCSLQMLHNKQKDKCEDQEFITFWYGRSRLIHLFGMLPPVVIPPLFFASWLLLFNNVVAQTPLPICNT